MDDFSLDTRIVIRVFSNLAGLSKTYLDAKIVTESASLRQFVQGFNKEYALCEYVDAGDDKEAADTKIKGVQSLSQWGSQASDTPARNDEVILYQ